MPGHAHPSLGRQLARGAGWAAGAVALVAALAVLGPIAFGYRPHTVLTGSMEPAISPGDVVVEEPISPRAASIGDVVTFRDPEDQSRLITHRVVAIRRAGAHLWFRTQGDANNTTEHWRIAGSGQLGRVAYTLPWIGHVAVLTHTGTGLLLLVIVPVLALAVDELLRIWRPQRQEINGEPG